MKIKIGHLEWRVVLNSEALDHDYGKCNDTKCEIHISGEQNDREFVSTLLHEMMHATFYAYGLRNKYKEDDEEHICGTVANGLAQAFCENKKLIKLLKEKIDNG